MNLFRCFAVAAVCGLPLAGSIAAQSPRPVTIDDLMALRTINDVKISPAGDRVAYVVSAPSVARNAHEPELYVMPSDGGTAIRVSPQSRIFSPALPAPRLRWSPDGERVSFLALVDGRPQVQVVRPSGGPTTNLTAAPEGVSHQSSRNLIGSNQTGAMFASKRGAS